MTQQQYKQKYKCNFSNVNRNTIIITLYRCNAWIKNKEKRPNIEAILFKMLNAIE